MARVTRSARRRPDLPWRQLAWFALLAVALRAFIPAGFMPAASSSAGTLWLSVCGSATERLFALEVPAPAEGTPAASGLQDCPFGLLAGPAGGPPVHLAWTPSPQVQASTPLARLAAPALPPPGPPLGSRAPPLA